MSISAKEYTRAISEASMLLEKHNVIQPPVAIKDIAKSFSIDVIAYNLGDNISGILMSKGDNATIGYNPTEPDVRQRFTIAHELGHFILHRNKKAKPDSEQLFVDRDFLVKYRSSYAYSDAEYIQEQQANAFAAAILMPEKLIFKELKKEEYKDLSETELIDALAKVFKVSAIAMTYRLTNLNVDLRT